MKAPIANRLEHTHQLHGDARKDDYYWLANRENPDVMRYLEEENEYYEEAMSSLQGSVDTLFTKMVARIPDVDIKVPVKDGAYYYFSRMDKDSQYPKYARKKSATRETLNELPEEIILDVNALAKEDDYLNVTVLHVSPDHNLLAYLENRDGTDRYTLQVKNLSTGEYLGENIENVYISESLEWDARGQYLFYLTVDDTQRPYRLWRHHLGDVGLDDLLYEETDCTCTLRLGKSRSGHFIFLTSESKTTTEVHYLATDEPLDSLHVFDLRRDDIQYQLEHWEESFLILTNEGARNFRLMHCPIHATDNAFRKDLFPYEDVRYLEAIYPFRGALLLEGRQDGLTQLWKYQNDTLTKLNWDEPVYTVTLGENASYDISEVLIHYESFLTPRTTYSLDLISGELTVLRVAPVSGDYMKSDYHQERLFAAAKDGKQVPMIAVYRKEALEQGPAPLILYAYGSYGANSDPQFDPYQLPLLDLGVVFVIAQVRGGSELGYDWYEEGKLLHKRNTFTDFIAAAEELIARGYTAKDLLAAWGGSAGGLLVGAVANMAGHLFKVMVPEVPFVDVVTTMLDASIPLTSLEWDEWGNPEDPEYYSYMLSYSPYDNVEAKTYPHMLVTTGLNDPRVAYWEPAKWVARLRAVKTDQHVLILKTNMGAGHFGSSGRINYLKELAASYAFMLDKMGVKVN